MQKHIEILLKCPLFSGVDKARLETVLSCLDAKIVSFDKKYTIMAEGTPAKYIGIVLSGSAQITQTDYYGNRRILGNIGSTELFGEAFACAEVRSLPVTVIASEPCEIMLIHCQRLLYTCSNNCSFHQQLIFNLMKDLATKSIMFHQKIEITSQRSTREKLMAYLMMQAKRAGNSSFDIPFDRQELADYLEVDRSGLSAEISKLKKEGVLECKKNHFQLLSEE